MRCFRNTKKNNSPTLPMHFGKKVKEVVDARNCTDGLIATVTNLSSKQLNELYNQAIWPSDLIKTFSKELDYDFGKLLGPQEDGVVPQHLDKAEFTLYLSFAKGQNKRLRGFLDEIRPIAEKWGVEVD